MEYSYIIATARIVDKNNNVLMLINKKIGNWGLPGGKVELGESPRSAVVREVKEETGLDIEVVRLLGAHEFYWKSDNEYWIELIFEAKIINGDTEIKEPSKILDLEYRQNTDLPEYQRFEFN